MLLIASYREEDLAAGDPLRAALGELTGQPATKRVELAPLSASAVRQLVGLDAAELRRLTGGNPFCVYLVSRWCWPTAGPACGFAGSGLAVNQSPGGPVWALSGAGRGAVERVQFGASLRCEVG